MMTPADFSLSPGGFGTDIIQKCTKWCQIGVHGLNIFKFFATFHCVSCLVRFFLKKPPGWETDLLVCEFIGCNRLVGRPMDLLFWPMDLLI